MHNDFLFDDLVTIHIHFKPIMHKFIFKPKDVDDEIFEDIYMSLIAFYDFLFRHKLLDGSDYKEFVRDIKGMKSELRGKMHRYNKIRHDNTISDEEKEDIREELFEGDYTWPFHQPVVLALVFLLSDFTFVGPGTSLAVSSIVRCLRNIRLILSMNLRRWRSLSLKRNLKIISNWQGGFS